MVGKKILRQTTPEPEPHVFGPLEPEQLEKKIPDPEPLAKKNQEPEPLGKAGSSALILKVEAWDLL